MRVYLGAAPGVGKTYALLDEVRRRTARGARALVVGVDSHHRPVTDELRAALEATFTDEPIAVDEVLARSVDVVAIDDLERPGHAAFAEALCEAGVPVITTLDVSSIASLSDVVERLTGRQPVGIIPDSSLVDAAIELVDITPEALRRRLAHGNVFPAGELDAATANVFRTENLAVLRELALRWVADHAQASTGEAHERVAVAITGRPGGDVVRRAARIASRTHAALVGIHVRTGVTPADELEEARRLVEDLGGEYREVAGVDVAATLVDAARAERATQLVLGASHRSRASALWRGSIVADVLKHAGGDLDVHVIGTTSPVGRPLRRRSTAEALPRRRRLIGWGIAAAGLPTLTAVLVHAGADLPSALLFYVLLVTAGAAVGGAWPATAGALGAFLLVNWYFIPPLHHWRVNRGADVLTLVTFAVVAAVVAGLVSHAARRQAESARARAEARMLARMSGLSADVEDPLVLLLTQLHDSFELSGVAVLRTDGHVVAHVGALPSTPDVVVPLGDAHRLVVGGRALSADDRGIIAVVADHLTAALRTRALRHEASRAEALTEADALRTAILAAVSHDLRTPLSSIKASVSSLRQDDVEWPEEAVDEFLATIEEETDRLDGLVGNLLDLSRVQTNTLQILEKQIGLEEVVPAAIASLGARGAGVVLDVPETLPRVVVDPGLLERAIANLVANAVAWSPAGVEVRVDACRVGDRVDVRVIDRGPGIPRDARERVFQPFQRLGDRGSDGVGLGLAVARGFVTAMHGDLVIEDTPGGGTTMVASFPVASGEASPR
jgi:two-component system sensor histidine kinase KdpD